VVDVSDHEHVYGKPVKGTRHCTVDGCAALHHECTLTRNDKGQTLCRDCGSGFPGFRLPGEPAPAGVETDLTRINTHTWVAEQQGTVRKVEAAQWAADQITARDRKRNRDFYRGRRSDEEQGRTPGRGRSM
jgi:hypothetical protein